MRTKNIITIVLISFASLCFSQRTNAQTSEKEVIANKHKQLSAEELKQKIIGKNNLGRLL